MPTFDLFSKRQKRARGEMPDVFQYEALPKPFRVQVVHILRDALGELTHYDETVSKAYGFIHNTLAREYGLFALNDDGRSGLYDSSVYQFLLETEDIERALDVIELAFRYINKVARGYAYSSRAQQRIEPDAAIEELNSRFLEHAIGYQFESNEIIRIDSKLIHREVMQPTLQVLSEKKYAGANREFLSAHDHYRRGRYKECLNECLKSFESTMKAICKEQQWPYGESDTAKKLLEICFLKGLIPPYMQAHFSSLRASLESGVPTLRNKISGHGQGAIPTEVPRYLAAYMLHLTASSILLLADAALEQFK